jgi:hypothetical protein
MTRRSALAASLLLTAIFAFFAIAYGSNAGIFAWNDGNGEAAPDVAFEPTKGPRPASTAAPRIVTEYVYVDEMATQQAEAARYAEGDDDDWYEHEGDEHEDDDDRYDDDHDDDDHDDHEREEHEEHDDDD